MTGSYDILVIGGGHAGCEAALAAARMGSSVLLLTPDLHGLAKMSCNPAVGGIAKGQIVREIDALGGGMGLVTDASTLQFRMLNRSKGPAMWSPRAQCDKQRFSANWLSLLLSCSNLSIYADFARDFLFENGKIVGARTITGAIFHARAVVLTAGTFLNGRMYIGQHSFEGGRIGEQASYGLTEQLASLGIPTARMKTGTPPRIDIRSLDLTRLAKQPGDPEPERFSYLDVDEEISKPTYNSSHKENRRKASFDKLEKNGGLLCDSAIAQPTRPDGKKMLKGHNFLTRQKTLEEEVLGTEEDDLYAALEAIPADQRALLLDIYADDVDQRVIADGEGVTESAISHRKERALARLKKELERIQKKSE